MCVRPSALLGSLAMLAVASSAQASLFSFASDTNTGPTFVGASNASGFVIRDSGPSNQFQLVIDDDNGPNPFVTLGVRFEANFQAQWVASTPIAGPTVLHSYSVTNGPGSSFAFRFNDLTTGQTLLTASLDAGSQGVFSVVGTNSSWGTAGAIRGSDSFATVTWTATQALVNKLLAMGVNPAAYGIFAGSSVSPDDFGFDLTALLSVTGGGVAINSQTHLPTGGWQSEGSFSGSAGAIPTPAAGGLAALGLILAGRRRRK